MTEEEVKITFGDYKLVDATEEQISELRKWENENSGHSFFEFETQCKKLDITFKLRIPPAWSGRSSTTPN